MLNNISAFSFAMLVSVAAVPTLAAPKNIPCTHPSNKEITQLLHSNSRLKEVHSYLSGKNVSHSVYDKNEQELDLSKTAKRELHRRGPLSILLASKFKKKSSWSLVTGGELLIIEFDINQRLKSYTCEKYFTGP